MCGGDLTVESGTGVLAAWLEGVSEDLVGGYYGEVTLMVVGG